MHIFNVWTIIVQSLNTKNGKLLELQIIQTRHHLRIVVQHPKHEECSWNVHKIGGTYVQWVNNHYKKFEYKGMKLLRITQTQNAGDYQKPVQLSGQSQLKIKRNLDMIPFFMKMSTSDF